MKTQYNPGDTVLGNWTLTRLIGAGSFGRVFEAERVDFGVTYKAAIKVITIPQNQSEVKNARAEGMDEGSVTAYFRGFVEELVREIALMSRLKGTANVVSYEDHTVISHTEGTGWDIIIRMELLVPLLDHMEHNTYTRKDVIKLGIDICRALELCQRFNIIHRDIKPENIFVSDMGDYKLGDFGIARTVDKTMDGLSRKGTFTYMAPEIHRDGSYGSTVDIYSLGIVLYRLLNDNRAPFLPTYPAPITHSDREIALAKCISGAKLPAPRNADGRLAEIVLKACAYDPQDRYSSPMQMKQELDAILYSREEASIIYPDGDETHIDLSEYGELISQGSERIVREKTTLIIDDEDIEKKPDHVLDTISNETNDALEDEKNKAAEIIPDNSGDIRDTGAMSLYSLFTSIWSDRKVALLAAISISVYLIANIFGYYVNMAWKLGYSNPIISNIAITLEVLMFLVFVFHKKSVYIGIALISNVIGNINNHLYLNYSNYWDNFLTMIPTIVAMSMFVMYLIALKGYIKKKASTLIFFVFCVVLIAFDTKVLYGVRYWLEYSYFDIHDIVDSLLPILHYGAYALVIIGLKNKQTATDKSCTPIAEDIPARSAFLLAAALISTVITLGSFLSLLWSMYGLGSPLYLLIATLLAVILIIGAFAFRRR